MQWNIDGGTLDSPGIQEPHQRSRVKSCPTGHQALLRTQTRKPQHTNLQMDNSTAVAYVNKRGRTKSSTLAELAVELWAVCHQNNIWITAQHLPGTQNVDADWASRQFNERTEWTLDKSIFTRIVRKFYTPQVDLFASRLNYYLPKYICVTTPRSRGDECGCNDLAMEQMDIIHSPPPPPIVMLPRILKKIREDQVTCLLIAPNWPAQTWYPLLLQLLINIPAILPMSEHTIYLPFNRQARHPLWRTLKLAVWPLSGDAVKQKAFHHRCATYS